MDYNKDLPEFPGLSDIHELDDQVKAQELKGLYDDLVAGHRITATAFYGEWEDDHYPCFNLSVTVNGKEHKFGMFWMAGSEFLFRHGAAPFVEAAHEETRKLLVAMLADSAPYVGQQQE